MRKADARKGGEKMSFRDYGRKFFSGLSLEYSVSFPIISGSR